MSYLTVSFIFFVTGSPASEAGLKAGDRLIEVDGINIERETHKQVVERIRAGGKMTTLLVVDRELDKYCQVNNITIKADMAPTTGVTTTVDGPKENGGHVVENGEVEAVIETREEVKEEEETVVEINKEEEKREEDEKEEEKVEDSKEEEEKPAEVVEVADPVEDEVEDYDREAATAIAAEVVATEMKKDEAEDYVAVVQVEPDMIPKPEREEVVESGPPPAREEEEEKEEKEMVGAFSLSI